MLNRYTWSEQANKTNKTTQDHKSMKMPG